VTLFPPRLRPLVRLLWYWLPPLIVMAAIFYASSRSSLPQAEGEWLDAFLKKVAHVAEYTLLFVLLVRAWSLHLLPLAACRAGWLTTLAYGISDEIHQSFVPRRHANWYDVVIDVAMPLLLCFLYTSAVRRGRGFRWARWLFHRQDGNLPE